MAKGKKSRTKGARKGTIRDEEERDEAVEEEASEPERTERRGDVPARGGMAAQMEATPHSSGGLIFGLVLIGLIALAVVAQLFVK